MYLSGLLGVHNHGVFIVERREVYSNNGITLPRSLPSGQHQDRLRYELDVNLLAVKIHRLREQFDESLLAVKIRQDSLRDKFEKNLLAGEINLTKTYLQVRSI